MVTTTLLYKVLFISTKTTRITIIYYKIIIITCRIIITIILIGHTEHQTKKSTHFFSISQLAQLSSSTRAHMKNKRMIIIITCSSSLFCLHSSLLSLFFPSIYLKNIFLSLLYQTHQQKKNIAHITLTHTHSTSQYTCNTTQSLGIHTFYIK